MKIRKLAAAVIWSTLFSVSGVAAGHPVKVVLFPSQEAVMVSQIEGTIEKYNYRVGQRFKAGACLVSFNDAVYRIEVERTAARKEEIQVQLKLARETLENQKKLFEQDFQSKLEIQRREADYASLKARLRSAEADCAEALLRVSYCRKLAPFDGRMEQIMCRAHETVRAGQPLFRIIDDREVLAVMNIPLAELKPVGTELFFDFGPAGRFSGKICEISPQADHRSGTIEIKALVSNHKGLLTCGMTGEWIKNPAPSK